MMMLMVLTDTDVLGSIHCGFPVSAPASRHCGEPDLLWSSYCDIDRSYYERGARLVLGWTQTSQSRAVEGAQQ